jgi:hypothetical protein
MINSLRERMHRRQSPTVNVKQALCPKNFFSGIAKKIYFNMTVGSHEFMSQAYVCDDLAKVQIHMLFTCLW